MNAEQLDVYRNRMLLALAFAFCFWQVPQTIGQFTELGTIAEVSTGILATFGALAWAFLLFRYSRIKAVINPEVECSDFDDERFRVNQLHAFKVGWICLVSWLALSVAVTKMVVVSAEGLIHIGFIISIVAPIFAFLLRERKEGLDVAS